MTDESEKGPEPEMLRERLIEEIQRVFDGVSREDGITLHEADAIDDWETEQEILRARRKDRDLRWQDVPDEEIEEHCHSLAHLDAKGLRYYLPAFMRWILRHGRDSGSLSVDFTIYTLCPRDEPRLRDYFHERLGGLVEHEARVVCRFLRFLLEHEQDSCDLDAAREALDRHWARFCDGTGSALET